MKILYLSPARDNLGSHDYRFLKAITDKGLEVHLVSYHWGDIDPRIRAIKNLKITHNRPRFFKKIQGVFYPHRIFHFKRLLREESPDVIHSGNVWNHSFFAALSGFHPLLVMPFGSDILIHPKKYPPLRWLTKFAVSRADMITCDADNVKSDIMITYGYPENRIIVFPWGVEHDIFNPSSGDDKLRREIGWDENVILIMNRHFEPVYGIKYFVRALKKVLHECPEVRVLMVGEGSLLESTKNTISGMGLDDKVHFTGRISQMRMANLLRISDIYVSSSVSDGTSVSLLEAMACGKPIICSDLTANLAWVKNDDNGIVFRSTDVQDLESAIIKLVKNLDQRISMGERNLKIARKKADWKKNVDLLISMYSDMVENAKSRPEY